MNQSKIFRGLVLALAMAPAFAQTTTTAPPPGRLLASNCYQCHGTNGSGGGIDSINGKSVNEIYNELKEMQRKSTPEMMDMHARGYTDAEIKLLATYLATLR